MKRSLCLLYGSLLFLSIGLAYSQSHRVGPGDTLFISVWGQEDLSGPVMVGPDGSISLPPPAGILQVERLTVDEITQLLTERLSEYLKNPRISVAIRESEGIIVHVFGQVAVPGFYKVPEDTSLQEVLSRAGGLTEYADMTQIQIRHQEEGEADQAHVVDFRQFIRENDLNANPIVGEKDTVFVPRLDEATYRQQRIRVLGAVQAPGVYPLDVSRPLLDVLALAEGLAVDADLAHIHILLSPQEPQSGVEVDLAAYLSGASTEGNPLVEPGQAVFIPSTRIPEEETYLVNVIGQLVRPGAYPVTKRTRLLEAIYLAGGFSDKAQLDRVALIRSAQEGYATVRLNVGDYLLGRDMDANPLLQEGDTILVPIDEEAMLVPPVQSVFLQSISVNIIGEVRTPGTYEFSQRGGILDVLTLAGGPTPDADLERATLLRGGSGSQEQIPFNLEDVLTEGAFDKLPVLQANDTIFVPMRKESWWRQFVRAAADVSTIAVALLILVEGRRP